MQISCNGQLTKVNEEKNQTKLRDKRHFAHSLLGPDNCLFCFVLFCSIRFCLFVLILAAADRSKQAPRVAQQSKLSAPWLGSCVRLRSTCNWPQPQPQPHHQVFVFFFSSVLSAISRLFVVLPIV